MNNKDLLVISRNAGESALFTLQNGLYDYVTFYTEGKREALPSGLEYTYVPNCLESMSDKELRAMNAELHSNGCTEATCFKKYQ